MFVGTLQFEILVRSSSSLKDKRRVVRSVKDTLHRHYQVSVAEVGSNEHLQRALMGLAVVAPSAPRCGEVIDHALERLRSLREGELGDHRRHITQFDQLTLAALDDQGNPVIDEPAFNAELLQRGIEAERNQP